MILISISENVNEEHVILTDRVMGDLMRAFILECAPRTDRERLLTLTTKSDELTLDEFRELNRLGVKHERGFAMHALMTLTQRGHSVGIQGSYLMLVLKFRGLSRSGLSMLASFGIGTPDSTFRRHRDKFLEAEIKETK